MEKVIRGCVLWLFSYTVFVGTSQICYDSRPLIESTFKKAIEEDWYKLKEGDLRIKIAEEFLGTPYVSGTLDKETGEELIVNLKGQDCTTFLEYVLSFSKCIKAKTYSDSAYFEMLEKIRYRDGQRDGYLSRLHYFSDWIIHNQDKGLIKDVTQDFGGVKRDKVIDFMSNHLESYKGIQSESDMIELQRIESVLNKKTFYFIPQDQIVEMQDNIKHGSLIVLTTSLKGLDVVHVGYAYRKNDRTHLIHASSDIKKVVISDKILADYVLGNKLQDGIIILE